jgi:hypothetical protein
LYSKNFQGRKINKIRGLWWCKKGLSGVFENTHVHFAACCGTFFLFVLSGRRKGALEMYRTRNLI